jgi:hypothetical protein
VQHRVLLPSGASQPAQQAQLKQFFHLTTVPFQESQARAGPYTSTDVPLQTSSGMTLAQADWLPKGAGSVADANLWCPYAGMNLRG